MNQTPRWFPAMGKRRRAWKKFENFSSGFCPVVLSLLGVNKLRLSAAGISHSPRLGLLMETSRRKLLGGNRMAIGSGLSIILLFARLVIGLLGNETNPGNCVRKALHISNVGTLAPFQCGSGRIRQVIKQWRW